MRTAGKQLTGGVILASGAIVCLLSRTYWLFAFPGAMTQLHRVTSFLFGNWLASIVAPTGLDGYDMSFHIKSLLWMPWAAVIIGFLLWGAFRAIRGRASQRLVTVMLVIGIWMALGFVYDKITWGMQYLSGNLSFLFAALLSDLASVAILVGILIVFLERTRLQERTLSKGAIMDSQGGGQPMTLSQILFSFDGRINRAKYWGYGILIGIISWIAVGLDVVTTGTIGIFYVISIVVVIWPALAISVKRCHDRNRTGWFVLVSLVPLVGIWYLIEVGFLRGTTGPNQYGPDPLAPSSSAEPVVTE